MRSVQVKTRLYRNFTFRYAVALILLVLSSASANENSNKPSAHGPSNELHIARLVFQHSPSYTWGPGRPWWRIDWPEAEHHFINGVQRYTAIDVAKDSAHISLLNDSIFDYPWLFAQQVGRWQLSDKEIKNLSEYLLRGGFLIVDDFHGPNQWNNFHNVISRALPGYKSVKLPVNATLLQIHYEMTQTTQIILTTHSPQVLNILNEDELDRIIITKYTKRSSTKMRHLSEEEIKHAKSVMSEEGLFLSDYWVHLNLEEGITW